MKYGYLRKSALKLKFGLAWELWFLKTWMIAALDQAVVPITLIRNWGNTFKGCPLQTSIFSYSKSLEASGSSLKDRFSALSDCMNYSSTSPLL
jgi:hypothetical protein